jgi:hypothetical protein
MSREGPFTGTRLNKTLISATAGMLGVVVVDAAFAAAEYQQHVVGNSWQWFTDYAFLTSDWTLNVEPNCAVEVASGLMVSGHPWGSTHQFTTYYHFTAYGAGAIHVRSVKQGQPCNVRLDMGYVSAIPVYSSPSVLPDAANAAKRIIEEHKEASENQMSPSNNPR